MAYNKGFNPDRLPMHAEPEQVCNLSFIERKATLMRIARPLL